MSKLTKWIVIGLVFVGILVAGAYFGLLWVMSQSMYQLGSVAEGKNLRGPLSPPKQDRPEVWKVESDIELDYQSYGEGKPVLVIHGGPGIPYEKQWKGLEPLNDQFRFYFYHQRGCGNSTRPFEKLDEGGFYPNMVKLDKTLGLGAQIADIERIRQILGEEKITIIGHSYGGFIATLYAAEFPNNVEKLILVAPAGVLTKMDDERDLFENAKKHLAKEDLAEYEKAIKAYMDFGNIFSQTDESLVQRHQEVGKFLLKAMGYDPKDFRSEIKPGGWAVFAMFFSAGMAPDYSAALSKITAPTLIVHGSDDELSLPGTKTYQPIAGSKFVMLKPIGENKFAGHFPFDDCPDQFSKVVADFLGNGEKPEPASTEKSASGK